jgi:hypothetical protein
MKHNATIITATVQQPWIASEEIWFTAFHRTGLKFTAEEKNKDNVTIVTAPVQQNEFALEPSRRI